MCNAQCIDFVASVLTAGDVAGRDVLEVGALDVNGTVRPVVEALGPASYIGVDLEHGPGVDEVLPAEDLLDRFGPGAFDVVISTELLEHVRDWRLVVRNLKLGAPPRGPGGGYNSQSGVPAARLPVGPLALRARGHGRDFRGLPGRKSRAGPGHGPGRVRHCPPAP